MPKSSTGYPGVSLDRTHGTCRVYARSDRQGEETRYLASFPISMIQLAAQMRAEADNTPPEEFPALKEKYEKLRDEWANQDAIDDAAESIEAESPITPPRFIHARYRAIYDRDLCRHHQRSAGGGYPGR